MEDCVFCKIINKELESKIVFENDEIMAFESIQPMAPIHILIVPKKHIESVAHLEGDDFDLVGRIVKVGKELAEDLKISEKGYKMMFHVGEHGGQEIKHLHLHLLGGAKLKEEIKIVV